MIHYDCRQPRNPQTRDRSPRLLIAAETRPVISIPPVNQTGPPISAPTTRPVPAAARKPDIIVARDPGSNSVQSLGFAKNNFTFSGIDR